MCSVKHTNNRQWSLTCVCLALFVVVSQRFVVEGQVDLDGGSSGFVVEWMLPQDVLQLQQVHVGAQRHLPHAVRVKVKLVVCDLHKVLMVGRKHERRGMRQSLWLHLWL